MKLHQCNRSETAKATALLLKNGKHTHTQMIHSINSKVLSFSWLILSTTKNIIHDIINGNYFHLFYSPKEYCN
jgi:hypothetical protein